MAESMVKMVKSRRDFAMVQNAPLRDKRLSLKAKGLYAIMVSLPDSWEYTVSGLAEVCGVGRDCIRSTLIDLEKAGYLDRCQHHTANGQFSSCEYIIYEYSKLDTPRENPSTGEPSTGEPLTGNRPQYNTDLSNTRFNNPPIVPQEGDGESVTEPEPKPKRKRKKRDPDALIPKWQPERFAGFWAAYPRGNDKARAVEEWDKLPQDKKLMAVHGDESALLDEIARGLKRQLRDRSWQEGIGIPYAFRWLRDRKWREQGIKPSDPSALDRFTQQEQPQQPRSYHTEVVDGEEVVIYDD